MHEAVEEALAAPTPGTVVAALSPPFPGVRRTRNQIIGHADHWRALAHSSLGHERPVLVALGDSLAQGIGARKPRNSHVSLVAAHLTEACGERIGVVNLSRSGATLADILDIQLHALDKLPYEPVAVVCTVGSNDLIRSSRVIQTRLDVSTLIEALPAHAVIATVPDRGSVMAKRLNRHIRAEAHRHGLLVADVARALTTWRGHVAGDGFHPNEKGHRVWAQTFISALGSDPHRRDPSRD